MYIHIRLCIYMYVTMYLSISRNITIAVLQHGIVSFVTSSGRRDGIVSFDYYIAISTHTHAGTHAHTHTHYYYYYNSVPIYR